MKKVKWSILVLAVVIWISGSVLAEGNCRMGGTQKKEDSSQKENKDKKCQDPNDNAKGKETEKKSAP